MTATSGRRCGELLQKSSPLGFLLKTLLVSPQWRSSIVYLNCDHWQVIDTVSETFIVERDPESSKLFWKRSKRSVTRSRRLLFLLRVRVPRTTDIEFLLWRSPLSTDGEKSGHGNLPHQEQAKYAGNGGRRPKYHETLPTPDARCWKSGKGRKENGHSPQLEARIGGTLNPMWVEWLMGFPIGWTDLEH